MAQRLDKSKVLFGLAHTYTGYPLVKEARVRVKSGEIGRVTKVVVEYSQEWLAGELHDENNKQAQWRLDPSQVGISCCLGDIGVHAANLAEWELLIP